MSITLVGQHESTNGWRIVDEENRMGRNEVSVAYRKDTLQVERGADRFKIWVYRIDPVGGGELATIRIDHNLSDEHMLTLCEELFGIDY